MRVALTGDLQFADQPRFSHIGEDGLTSRLRDQIACFEWIVRTSIDAGCETLLVLGDVFDQRNAVTATVLDQVCGSFAWASEQYAEWIQVLVGNHDTPLRIPTVTSLKALSGHAMIWAEPGTWMDFAFAPWMQDPDDYRTMIGELAADKDARYLLSHVMVVGAVPAEVGKQHADLRPKRWERIFLGDIHEPHSFTKSRIQYVGAPMQHHFGDAGGERGYWILDTETGEYEFVENTISPRFHIVDSIEGLTDIGHRDFVRVQTEDDEVGEALARQAGQTTRNVESRAVVLDDPDPRLDVRTEQSCRDILAAYVEHCGVDDDGLVAIGLEILDEVRG